MSWWRGEKCNDLPMTSQEILILETYEGETERGLLHNDTWHKRMAQLVALREEQAREDGKCPGGRMSPRDPNFDPDHVFVNGMCAQCGTRVDQS